MCVLTSATSILSLEGISTEDIVAALERHSSRYGIPGIIFTDNGTQLAALTSASFTPRRLENELKEKLDVKVLVSCPKAHEEQGRVERRIRLIRDMLQRTGEAISVPQSPLMWETTFARISNALNNHPIAKSNQTNLSSDTFDIITPNRLILGRNNVRGHTC